MHVPLNYALADAVFGILRGSSIGEVMVGFLMFLGSIWIAFFFGILVGWAWKPRWGNSVRGKFEVFASSASSPGAESPPLVSSDSVLNEQLLLKPPTRISHKSSSSELKEEKNVVVTEEDLKHLCNLIERKDGGRPWKHVMDHSTNTISYQAWQREPETGPTQYCSITIYEDATPELLRDFFWDDEFRLEWDNMIIQCKTLEACPTTGTMIVHWVRKFPFFCSNREYIIGRRIWESGRSFYCVTKGVPYPSIPRRDKPRRVDLFYSSWFIQAVGSKRRGDGRLTSCEVILFHHEDMGISKEIAKFGVRQGMWGAVRNIERGLRAYQKHRASGAALSNSAFMASINTKLNPDFLKSLESEEISTSETKELVEESPEKPKGMNIQKLILLGGVIVVACSLNKSLLTKTLVFNVVRRFSNIGRVNPQV